MYRITAEYDEKRIAAVKVEVVDPKATKYDRRRYLAVPGSIELSKSHDYACAFSHSKDGNCHYVVVCGDAKCWFTIHNDIIDATPLYEQQALLLSHMFTAYWVYGFAVPSEWLPELAAGKYTYVFNRSAFIFTDVKRETPLHLSRVYALRHANYRHESYAEIPIERTTDPKESAYETLIRERFSHMSPAAEYRSRKLVCYHRLIQQFCPSIPTTVSEDILSRHAEKTLCYRSPHSRTGTWIGYERVSGYWYLR